MNFIVSKTVVKQSLAAHSVIGLVVGVLMYLICLTGTLAVFAEAFERWEQPGIAEFYHYDAAMISRAWQQFIDRVEEVPESLYVIFPTDDLPRMHVSGGEQEWYMQPDGALSEPPKDGWTAMLKALHISLHLPETPGVMLVSAVGAMLLALIISGVLAHPRIFKDAFRLRRGGNRRLEQADLHNRLSVWALPFHLMIALTGAVFGLVGLLIFVAATAFYQGDSDALIADVYGSDPVIDAPVQPLNVAAALATLAEQAPTAEPIYIVAHNIGSRQQYMEIAATLPGRLIYSEIYRFAADGRYLGDQGFADGPLARQLVYSVYRIHFGWFGGLWVKAAYVLLGLAMTVVSVSGVNIWLARRARRDWINALWCGTVWGVPLALCCSAFFNVIMGLSAVGFFIISWLACLVFCCFSADEQRSAIYLKRAIAVGLCSLTIAYAMVFSAQINSGVFFGLSAALIITAATLALAGIKNSPLKQPATGASDNH